MKKYYILILMIGLALSTISLPVFAIDKHFSGFDSVDEKEIRYDGSTKYTDAQNWAINQWNALGKVNILPDVWWTYSDLEWRDIDTDRVTYSAWYGYSPTTAFMFMNDHYLKTETTSYRRTAATHEMGHALGIDDHSAVYSDQLMYEAAWSVNTPQSHDTADYNTLWK